MNALDHEFKLECQQFAARIALEAAEHLPTQQRIMLYQGILPLLPEGSRERDHAEAVKESLVRADKNQLSLLEILKAS